MNDMSPVREATHEATQDGTHEAIVLALDALRAARPAVQAAASDPAMSAWSRKIHSRILDQLDTAITAAEQAVRRTLRR